LANLTPVLRHSLGWSQSFNTLPRMSRTVGNGSKVAPLISQKTWLDSFPSTQRVVKPWGKGAPPQETEQAQQRYHAEQRAIWAREGVFWCKHTETFESRLEGQPSNPVSGHWFHNKERGVLEMYNDLRQPPMQTKEVLFFNKRAK
jgi:hypothetical protein